MPPTPTRTFLRTGRALAVIAALAVAAAPAPPARGENAPGVSFRRISPQWIAALGDPDAGSGSGAQFWGLWRRDPGPRGLRPS